MQLLKFRLSMGLLYSSTLPPKGVFGIWDNEESDDYFLSQLHLHAEEQAELSQLKGRKKSEWLSSRYLLHFLSKQDQRRPCLKDAFGKPYLKGSKQHISISHSKQLTAVIKSPKPVGIDIQIITPKIERIAPKFVSTDEFQFIPSTGSIHYFHAIWGAKESMYKCYGRREVDFKKHMQVIEFKFCPEGFYFQGVFKKESYQKNFSLFCQQISQFNLVYAIEI